MISDVTGNGSSSSLNIVGGEQGNSSFPLVSHSRILGLADSNDIQCTFTNRQGEDYISLKNDHQHLNDILKTT